MSASGEWEEEGSLDEVLGFDFGCDGFKVGIWWRMGVGNWRR
jgi:hypothetical protein